MLRRERAQWRDAANLNLQARDTARAEAASLSRSLNQIQDERAETFQRLDCAVGGTGLTPYQPEIDALIEARILALAHDAARLKAVEHHWCKDGETIEARLDRERKDNLMLMDLLAKAKVAGEALRDAAPNPDATPLFEGTTLRQMVHAITQEDRYPVIFADCVAKALQAAWERAARAGQDV